MPCVTRVTAAPKLPAKEKIVSNTSTAAAPKLLAKEYIVSNRSIIIIIFSCNIQSDTPQNVYKKSVNG